MKTFGYVAAGFALLLGLGSAPALAIGPVDGEVGAGHHEIRWDGRDAYQQSVASGVYLVRIEAGSFVEQKKMILLR